LSDRKTPSGRNPKSNRGKTGKYTNNRINIASKFYN